MEQDQGAKSENISELKGKIYLLSITGEVEGHEALGDRAKTTKYEHILPRLAMVEDDERVEGLLVLLNTVGGDVEAGLAIVCIPRAGRRSFDRRTPGRIGRLFLYCAQRYHGHPSGALQRYVHRRDAIL